MKERTVIAMLLLLVGVSMAQRASSAQASKTHGAIPRIEIELIPEAHGGSQPACEMVVVDPHQNKTGLDNNQGRPWLEVPKSSYEGNPNRVITIYDPAEGEYWLGIYGKSDGVYTLTVSFRRDDGSVFLSSYRAPLKSLSVHTYSLFYSAERVGVHRDSAPPLGE